MRISDWSSDVCSSDRVPRNKVAAIEALGAEARIVGLSQDDAQVEVDRLVAEEGMVSLPPFDHPDVIAGQGTLGLEMLEELPEARSEEHTSELQSLMRISYAVFCLKKKKETQASNKY